MGQTNSIKQKQNKSWKAKFIIIFCIFSVAAVGFWLFQNRTVKGTETSDTTQQAEQILVVVTNPVLRTFENVAVTQGNVESKNITLVSPRIQGVLEEIFIDEGDVVTAGETVLFQTDSVKLQQNVTIREHDLAVAIQAGRQAEANLEKVTADFEKAELDFSRYERLLEKDATTQDIFEQKQSNYKQLAASAKVSQAQVELTIEQISQAQAALTIARKDLTDTTIVASIDGVVSIRMAEPGEMGSPGVPVLQIEDPNIIEISAFLPAAMYPTVIKDQTIMRVTISGIDLGDQIVSYKSPTIQSKLRTFEVKCLVEDPPDGVAPGAMAEISIVLINREGLGVPAASIQQRSNQSVVFVTEGDTVHMVTVQTGLENEEWIEILDGDLTESSSVVYMGQNMLEEGMLVSIQEETN